MDEVDFQERRLRVARLLQREALPRLEAMVAADYPIRQTFSEKNNNTPIQPRRVDQAVALLHVIHSHKEQTHVKSSIRQIIIPKTT